MRDGAVAALGRDLPVRLLQGGRATCGTGADVERLHRACLQPGQADFGVRWGEHLGGQP